MTNIQASLLIHQLEKVEIFLTKKENICKEYTKGFNDNKNIEIHKIVPNSRHARYVYTILVNPVKRDEYLNILQEKGIGIAVNFRPIHLMSYYKKKYKFQRGDFPIAEYIGSSTITLPLYPKLKKTEINYVIQTVNTITA